MRFLKRSFDAESLAVQEFKDEGAFLFAADRAADALKRRLTSAHPNVKTFPISRDELQQIVSQFSRAVDTAKEYHLGAADLPGA